MITKDQLIGTWKAESYPLEPLGDVFLEFTEDDKLIHTTRKNGMRQIINLTFKIEGEYIVSDQPSAPRIEKSKVSLVDNKLIVEYDGVVSSFIKI